MLATTRKVLPAKVDVAHRISAGVLVDTGQTCQWERRLSTLAGVYRGMALTLWGEAPLGEVLRVVCEGLQWLGCGQDETAQGPTACCRWNKSLVMAATSAWGMAAKAGAASPGMRCV
jgi:hypothetical protein